QWQVHLNKVFYGLRGTRLGEFYQTFASADYRLAHALAADYFDRVKKREKDGSRFDVRRSESQPRTSNIEQSILTIMEWGCGNGNLGACFLSHLKTLDKDGLVYPRVKYVFVDNQEEALAAARKHPDLAAHLERVEFLTGEVTDLKGTADGTADLILCNELWNDLPTKLMLRKPGEIEEEYIRPNLHETRYAEIEDWSAFVRAFEAADVAALRTFPAFLEDLIWEREFRKAEWKEVPYRKTITEFLRNIDEEVLVPVNLGAAATLKEAKRLLRADAVGFHSFDAGTAALEVLNDPDKPCYGQFGGQYSFMVNFGLLESLARHLGLAIVTVEPQKEFVGASLGTNVLSLMDLLAAHPNSGSLKAWEQDRLILQTILALNEAVAGPYRRTIEFPIRPDTPETERLELQRLLSSFKWDGVPDTIAYVTEEEIFGAMKALEPLGYDREIIRDALQANPPGVEYQHFFCRLV
ncbi:MAG: class I SAM-dependent methyltransferase, partial [Nitrospirales bacterium]